ncbi:hypothetical protein ABZP36_032299 [Zizania latifolia]
MAPGRGGNPGPSWHGPLASSSSSAAAAAPPSAMHINNLAARVCTSRFWVYCWGFIRLSIIPTVSYINCLPYLGRLGNMLTVAHGARDPGMEVGFWKCQELVAHAYCFDFCW